MKCMCKSGFLGKDCNIVCPTSKNGEVCSRRGMGTLNTVGKAAKCDCKSGFVGPSCSHVCPSAGGKVCGGRGKCSFNSRDGTAQCKWHREYAGANCSKKCPVDANGTICGGNVAASCGTIGRSASVMPGTQARTASLGFVQP